MIKAKRITKSNKEFCSSCLFTLDDKPNKKLFKIRFETYGCKCDLCLCEDCLDELKQAINKLQSKCKGERK